MTIDPSSGLLPHVEFDDPDLGVAGFEEGAEALEYDHVVVDEGDPNWFGHVVTLGLSVLVEYHPIG